MRLSAVCKNTVTAFEKHKMYADSLRAMSAGRKIHKRR